MSSAVTTQNPAGRIAHTYPGSHYLLPHDEEERERLSRQHHVYIRLVSGRLVLPPISFSENDSVLDIGTGTGAWLPDVPRHLPESAQLYGIDIEPRLFPSRTALPPNVHLSLCSATHLPPNWTVPGETRVQLDLSGLVSFYDTDLAPSLVPIRANQERWDHRVQNMSRQDLSAILTRLEAVVTRPAGQSSGTDWATLIQFLVDRYAGRLAVTRHLLGSPIPITERLLDLANKVQTQLRIMLGPYLLLSPVPGDRFNMDWSIPIFELCATTHTHGLASSQHAMTDSEKLILRAVGGTNREICRVVTRMWAASIHAGIDPLLSTRKPPAAELAPG